MIGYVTIGTNDLARSCQFYDAILTPLGAKAIIRSPKMVFYALEGGSTMLAVSAPYNAGQASHGNGSMFGVPAQSKALVDEVHRIAMSNDAADEGQPGYRTPEMYVAYFRDPLGNKLAVYHIPSVAAFAEGAVKMLAEMLAAPDGAHL